MINDDVVKCPLCGGFTHLDDPALLAALHEPRIREQVEKYVTDILRSPLRPAASGAAKPRVNDFQSQVHQWNPFVPMWRRSPKE